MVLEVTNALGRTILVLDSDQRATQLAEAHGNLNPGSLSLWNALIDLGRPWDLVLDIGANYGEMLAGSINVPGKRIVAFEPDPAIAKLLERTIAGLPFVVELVESAVFSSDDGEVSFLSDKVWSGTSHLAAVEGGVVGDRYEVITVPTTTLDARFPEPPDSAFVKIDVEGAELHVLAGAEHFLTTTHQVAIMVEILHMAVQDLWALRANYQLALWSDEVGGIVVVDAQNAEELGQLLHSGDYYRQDAVLIAGRDAPSLVDTLRERWGTTSQRADRRRQELDAITASHVAAVVAASKERDELAAELAHAQGRESALRAENEQLSLQLDVRAAELEFVGAKVGETAAQVAEKQREIDAFKRSRAYRYASVYRKTIRRFGRR